MDFYFQFIHSCFGAECKYRKYCDWSKVANKLPGVGWQEKCFLEIRGGSPHLAKPEWCGDFLVSYLVFSWCHVRAKMYENDIPTPPSTVRLPQVSFLQAFKNLKAFPLLSIICQTLFESFTVHTHVSHLFSALISGQGIKQATKTKEKRQAKTKPKRKKLKYIKIHEQQKWTTKTNHQTNKQTATRRGPWKF